MYNENSIIVTTPAQLQELIGNAIVGVFPRLMKLRLPDEVKMPDGMNVEAAVRFFASMGMPTTPKTIYNLVFKKAIPYKKFGRRVVFSRRELTEWIETRTTRPQESKEDAALRIAAAARGKEVPR